MARQPIGESITCVVRRKQYSVTEWNSMPRVMSPGNHSLRSACTAVVIMAFACGLASAVHAQAANDSAAPALEDAVDADTEPGDDFFLYANSGWLKATEIPAGKGLWGARSEIAQRTRQQVAKLLDDANAAPAGSDARKVADFRAAYLNEAAIEARGIAPLKPLLA